MKDELPELRKEVEGCRRCELWRERKIPVFGEGPEDAEILLVGLGPGYHENMEGRPFVGAAGRLLDKLLELAGLRRGDIYITNVIKCYLPDNKATEEEIRACAPYLDRQIETIKPKIIIPLGNVATKHVFNRFGLKLASMYDLHGRIFSATSLFLQAKIIPMYHPAAALRNPGLNKVVKSDWKDLGEVLGETPTPHS
jgi:uracil-DNA glycosylase family 4